MSEGIAEQPRYPGTGVLRAYEDGKCIQVNLEFFPPTFQVKILSDSFVWEVAYTEAERKDHNKKVKRERERENKIFQGLSQSDLHK